MSHAFTLHVPTASPFPGLAADLAARYAETVGGSAAEAAAFSAEVAAGIEAVAAGETGVDLAFERGATGVEVAIRCGAASRTVQHTLAAPAPSA